MNSKPHYKITKLHFYITKFIHSLMAVCCYYIIFTGLNYTSHRQDFMHLNFFFISLVISFWAFKLLIIA
jgi:hypothetical protein